MMRLRRYCVCARELPLLYFWTRAGAYRFFERMQCVYLYRWKNGDWHLIEKRMWNGEKDHGRQGSE